MYMAQMIRGFYLPGTFMEDFGSPEFQVPIDYDRLIILWKALYIFLKPRVSLSASYSKTSSIPNKKWGSQWDLESNISCMNHQKNIR